MTARHRILEHRGADADSWFRVFDRMTLLRGGDVVPKLSSTP
jgi:hypothetical protein